jgi:hypothetical protein
MTWIRHLKIEQFDRGEKYGYSGIRRCSHSSHFKEEWGIKDWSGKGRGEGRDQDNENRGQIEPNGGKAPIKNTHTQGNWEAQTTPTHPRKKRGHMETGVKVNQQPPMHQLVILSIGWAAFFHSVSNGVHHTPFLCIADHCSFFFFFGLCFVIFF